MEESDSLASDIESLREHYDSLAREHGNSPAAVQQSSLETQERRLQVLTEIAPLEDARILDFGCGNAGLLTMLKRKAGFRGDQYTGYDISSELLALAGDLHPEATFEKRDIFTDGIEGEFDYVFISGVFNNLIADNRAFLMAALGKLFEHATKGLAFNALSTYVDYKDEGLYYEDPSFLFEYCKENLSPTVTLRHDYHVKDSAPPFECTVYVYKSSFEPRKNLGAQEMNRKV